MQVELNFNMQDLEKILSGLSHIPDQIPKAVERTMAKTLRHMVVVHSRAVSFESELKQKFIRKGIVQSHAWWSGDEVRGHIVGTEGRQPLFRYKTTPTSPSARKPPKGAAAHVLRGKENVTIPGSFVSQMNSGHIGIFKRKPDATYDKSRKKTLGIKELTGPSIQWYFKRDSISKLEKQEFEEWFMKVLRHEVEYIASQFAEGRV